MVQKKSEIRIYPSFTEVREDVTATAPHVVYLEQDLYNQIMSGSLSLEGVKVLSMNAVLKDTNLEGKILHIHKEKEVKKVQVIRGRDLLVQDLETKRYFNVARDQIEFTDVPEETGTEVTFQLEKPGDAVLSYLMYGINWKPRYTFDIENDKHQFQGWADINNNTQREYAIDKTELFGGDVSVGRPQNRAYAMESVNMCAPMMAMARSAPKIQSEGEKSGLYVYSINDKYILAPRSTFSLPLLTPKIKLEKISLYNSYFCESKSKGKFSRVYRISSDVFLPNGQVIVREDGRVVGQAKIPDLTANEENDLNVGNDPDVSYEREVSKSEVNNESSKFEVKVTFSNNKAREVKFEYSENVHDRHEVVEKEPNMTFQNEQLKYQASLPANGSLTIKYTLVMHYN